MDSRLFHYVVAVEECGTISSAARTLFLSQPALTKQIGKLESELGFQIFDRSKNPLGITEQGEIFLDFAGRYLELEKAGAPFEELEQLTLGSLRKAVQEGDAKNGSLMAGQIAGMIKEERSCEDIIKTTVVDAGKLMNGVNADE